MATYLDAILAYHRARAATDTRDSDELEASALAAGSVRDFKAALRLTAASRTAVIAEIKRRSPSKGELGLQISVGDLARCYEAGGASCLSVLTDQPHFGGSPADLVAARASTSIPVLRKDFTVSIRDLYDARIMGADAVLLIVAALSDDELATFVDSARRTGLAALVEVHDEHEVERALKADADIVGVNQRDLHSFSVDTDRAVRVAKAVPAGVVSVAESGISTPDQVQRLTDAGFDAILVGEALVTAGDPGAMLQYLVAPAADSRVRSAHDPSETE